MDFQNLRTFSEKLQWIKLYDRNPLYTVMADKYAARDYVKGKWGEEYLVPLLGVWNRAEDINFDTLPNEFIMKGNHNSGNILFCKDKSQLDAEKYRKKFGEILKKNYYFSSGEWPYRNIKPKIIAEKWMKNTDGSSPIDFKLFCFNGKVRLFQINSSRVEKEYCRCDYFDMNWERLDLVDPGVEPTDIAWKKPSYFDHMVKLAEIATEGIPFCRVDLMIFDERIYFSEFTFFHEGGMIPYESGEWEKKLGDMLVLPE